MIQEHWFLEVLRVSRTIIQLLVLASLGYCVYSSLPSNMGRAILTAFGLPAVMYIGLRYIYEARDIPQ